MPLARIIRAGDPIVIGSNVRQNLRNAVSVFVRPPSAIRSTSGAFKGDRLAGSAKSCAMRACGRVGRLSELGVYGTDPRCRASTGTIRALMPRGAAIASQYLAESRCCGGAASLPRNPPLARAFSDARRPLCGFDGIGTSGNGNDSLAPMPGRNSRPNPPNGGIGDVASRTLGSSGVAHRGKLNFSHGAVIVVPR
jgi:hypothetical protein